MPFLTCAQVERQALRFQALIGRLAVIMQLANEKLPAQLRRSSRFRKMAAILIAAYAVKKLSPYVWRRLQVRHTPGSQR